MKQNAVVTNFEQDFDTDEKAMGRRNIDAASTAIVTTDDAGLMSPEYKAKLDGLEPQQKADWNADRGITEILNKPYVGKQFTEVVYEQDTFDDITAKLAGGYNLVLVGANGDYIGQFKQSNSSVAIFEGYHIQPMRFVEFRCTADGWKQYTYYPTDMAMPLVYTRDRVGISDHQITLPNMDFDVTAYMSSVQWQYEGSDISETMFDEFVLRKPQLIRYDFSANLRHGLDGDPTVSPTVFAHTQLGDTYAATQTSQNVDEILPYTPYVLLQFNNYEQVVDTWYSDWVHLEYSAYIDRQRFEALFGESYYAAFFLRMTMSVLDSVQLPGSYHWVEVMSAHEQFTFYNHV